MTCVTVDVAGGPMGGAARFRDELLTYLARVQRTDVQVIGSNRRLNPDWLLRREMIGSLQSRRVALNNVGFVSPGGERWTLLGNALHFLTESEVSRLHPSLRSVAGRQASVVRMAARRSDVLVAPCSAMAERVAQIMPTVTQRLIVRMHPVSPGLVTAQRQDQTVLCPTLFEPYKHMDRRIAEWIDAVDQHFAPAVQLLVTASPEEVPASLANNPRVRLVGRLAHADLCRLWSRSRAVFFPCGLESFGFPLAEARASGYPVIARDTPQNQEIAGPALCGFTIGDADSLRQAIELALTRNPVPDPAPFDPNAYFNWMLGTQS